MSFPSLTDAELDLGIVSAHKKFGCTIMRRNLVKVSERLISFRYEGLAFEDALRAALDSFSLSGERREWYKTALGAAFSSRAKPMHKGRSSKKGLRTARESRYTINQDGQYGFVLPHATVESSHGKVPSP